MPRLSVFYATKKAVLGTAFFSDFLIYSSSFGKNMRADKALIALANTNNTPNMPIRMVTNGLPASACHTRVIPSSVTKWKQKYAASNTNKPIAKVIRENLYKFFLFTITSSFDYTFAKVTQGYLETSSIISSILPLGSQSNAANNAAGNII